MGKILIDLKKVLNVGRAVSTDQARYIINGVCVNEFEKDGKLYRDYVATDGRCLLLDRERIKEITIENPIIMKPEKCKFTADEKKLKKIFVELTEIGGNYFHSFGKFEKLEGVFPEYQKQILPQTLKETTCYHYIDDKYIKMIREFFDDKRKRFYSKKNKPEETQFSVDYSGDSFKMAVVMPFHIDFCNGLDRVNEELKSWNF